MAFKRIMGILEGNYFVEITKAEVINYNDGRQAIKVVVKTREDVFGNFLIFTNNVQLINKLIDVTYENCIDEEIDERDFIGVTMEITTKEKNGYINIVDIKQVEFEDYE